MEMTVEFPALLRLIEERSAAFWAAVLAAPDLDARVPTCPEWALRDLVGHLGKVHRFWAEAVGAGPADAPPSPSAAEEAERNAPGERDALVAWSEESTRLLLDALREAGPDRGCWTWWGMSPSPQNAYSVARHQVQEATVHTYDAQITGGAAEPLPVEAALDGVEEFLSTGVATTGKWPYEAAILDFHATEGRSWRVLLDAGGVRAVRLSADDAAKGAPSEGEGAGRAFASLRGTAAELVLVLYSRIQIDSLELDGDERVFSLLRDWDPDA